MDSVPFPHTELFGASPARTPVIVVKRRRLAGTAAPSDPLPAGGSESRRPRVFVLPGTGTPSPAAMPAPAEPAAPRITRRRPRRDPQRLPGAVVQVLAPAPEPVPEAAGPADGLGFELGDDEYPKVLAEIEAVRRLLDDAAAAAQLRYMPR